MTRIRILIHRIRGLFLKRRLEQDLQDEIRAHLEMQIEDNLRQGMSGKQARQAALRKFGGVDQVKERYRHKRSLPFIEKTLQDLRYAVRTLRKNPSFTAVAVLSLALGIGANTAIFSLVDAMLLRALPVKNPEKLVTLKTINPRNSEDILSYPLYKHIREAQGPFDGVTASTVVRPLSVSLNDQPEMAQIQMVSGNFFSVLGASPLIGRTLGPEDDLVPGGHPVAVISHGYWKRRFGLDQSAIGQTITIKDTAFTIVGIMPSAFFGVSVDSSPDIWMPMMMKTQIMGRPAHFEDGGYTNYYVIGRLRDVISMSQADPQINVTYQQYLSDRSGSNIDPQKQKENLSQRIELVTASKGLSRLRQQFSKPLLILMAVVGLVLLIACVNVANLLLAKAAHRQKEFAVRLALGAGRPRLIRQLLTESIVLALLGCAAGLVFAWMVSNIVVTYLASQLFTSISANLQFHLDGRMMAFTVFISVVTGLIFGIAPALRLTQIDLNPALQGGSSLAGNAFSRQRLDKSLMAGQVALSLVLLIVAGLFVRTLQNLNSIDVGFGGKNLWQMPLGLESSGYRPAQMPGLYREIMEKVTSLPGVESASLSESGLMTGNESGFCCLSADGETPREGRNGRVRYDLVSAGFFETAGFQLVRGRGITAQDTEGTLRVVVINEQLARDYFRGENPVGRRMSFSGGSESKPFEVVGVVKDAKYNSLRSQPQNFIYLPYDQNRNMGALGFLEIRTRGESFGVIANVRREVLATAKNLLIIKASTIAEQVDDSIAEERMIVKLSSLFSLLALLLAAVGLYGVMSYAVARKTREIGIRMALGAQPNQVMVAILRESMLIVIVGIIVGIGVALATTRFISSLLFGVEHYDPLTISVATLLLIAVALIASYLPARRASTVHPSLALRCE